MWKQTTILLITLGLTGTLCAQNFCGHIKYRYIYKNTKTGKDVTKKTNDVKTEDVYICGNKIKTYYDGKLENMFIGDSATYFQSTAENKFGYIRADSAYGQDVPVFTPVEGLATYNGKSYHAIENKTDVDKMTYYFNDVVKIDPKDFSKFELYQWNTFYNATNGGIRLVSIYVDADMTIISEAIKIEEKGLKDEDFKLPPGYSAEPFHTMNVEN